MENKYYIPEIQEFYIGFEFEYKSYKGNLLNKEDVITEWIKCDDLSNEWDYEDCSLYAVVKRIRDNEIRVKYLDQEDIKNLGWKNCKHNKDLEVISKHTFEFSKQQNQEITALKEFCSILNPNSNVKSSLDLPYQLIITNTNNIIILDTALSCYHYKWSKIFTGVIKNKQELKKIMQQLQII